MAACPHCNGTGHVPDHADPLEQLRAACRERGVYVSPDGLVREDTAADLMGLAAKTLRNWRYALDARTPDHVKRNGRTMYYLAAIAAQLK